MCCLVCGLACGVVCNEVCGATFGAVCGVMYRLVCGEVCFWPMLMCAFACPCVSLSAFVCFVCAFVGSLIFSRFCVCVCFVPHEICECCVFCL